MINEYSGYYYLETKGRFERHAVDYEDSEESSWFCTDCDHNSEEVDIDPYDDFCEYCDTD